MSEQLSRDRLFGVLNLHKPPGMTSRDVVNHVQRIVRPNKVGHAGTLDPMATGVLLVCVGPATRLVSLLQQAPKTYEADFRLGECSDTDDSTGAVEVVNGVNPVPRERVEQALKTFVGVIQQTPPAYSAVKVGGKRAYAMARAGDDVTLQPRPVRIDSIDITEFVWPTLTLKIRCGSGTYIRSIARDLGEQLECGGLMSRLVRTAIGEFQLPDATRLDDLTEVTLADALLPAVRVVQHVSEYRCSEAEQQIVARGGSFDLQKPQLTRRRLEADRPGDAEEQAKTPPVALVSAGGDELLALAEIRRQGRRIQPRTVFMSGG